MQALEQNEIKKINKRSTMAWLLMTSRPSTRVKFGKKFRDRTRRPPKKNPAGSDGCLEWCSDLTIQNHSW
jgi:hypothetical protein